MKNENENNLKQNKKTIPPNKFEMKLARYCFLATMFQNVGLKTMLKIET